MKLDLHVHTLYSPDAINNAEDIRRMMKLRGLDGVAITDHDTIKGALKISSLIKEYLIIPGIEISTKYGHIILLNVTREPPITDDLGEIRDFTLSENSVMIIAHPLSTFRKSKYFEKTLEYVDAVEVANSHDHRLKRNYEKLTNICRKYNKGKTAGSDSHIPDTIGYSYITLQSENIDSILEDIKRGDGIIYFKPVSIIHRAKKLFYEALHRARLYRPVPL